MGAATVQQIMKVGYAEFERTHRLPSHVRKAAYQIMACRTSKLGGHVQSCPDGHFQRHWYNSCKHRSCPQCASIQIERWLLKQKAKLLDCPHYHSIFTMSHDLNSLWLQNVGVMTKLFFRTVKETLYAFFDNPRHLGARPGIIAALHTWNQTLDLHPHLHCLITGGGLTSDDQWVEVKNGYLLPVRAVMVKFRGKLLSYIEDALKVGLLQWPKDMAWQDWARLRRKMRRQKWNVNIRQRYNHGNGVATYLARYLRGGPIKNSRILSCNGKEVSFHYRVNGDQGKENQRGSLTLKIENFIQRYFLHIPNHRTKLVRYWGIYAATSYKKLNRCREQLNQEPINRHPEFLDWQSYCEKLGEKHPESCPVCGRRMTLLKIIIPERAKIFHDAEEAA